LRFLEFEDEVDRLVSGAAKSLGREVAAEVSLPPNPSYGDLSSSAPLRLAKELGQRPGEVALKMADWIMRQSKNYRYVSSVTAHPGGYLNFDLEFSKFAADAVAEAMSGTPLGTSDAGRGKRVAVEHTAVNPSKALHIGHARNLVLGDSLVRVMRHLGYDVQALNYIDDSGAQVADVIVGYKFLGISDSPPEGVKFDTYSGDNVYTRVTREYGTNPALKEKQTLVLQEIEKGEGEIADYARSLVRKILSAQLETCWRLGASYDLLNWESQIVHSGMWSKLFEILKERRVLSYETSGPNKGCWVIPDPETGEQKVVVRSDGTVVYVGKDMPYAAWKIGLVEDPFGYEKYPGRQPDGRTLYTTTMKRGAGPPSFGSVDLAITVIDSKQSYLQRIVAKVLDSVESGSAKRYLHRAYEVVALSKETAQQLGFKIEGDFAHMSGRKGLYVNVDGMLEALKKKAAEETRKRNPAESEGWIEDVAEALAVAALRYELLRQDPDKLIVFDVEESLRFEGDTGPYLLYTYARARRILDKTGGVPRIDSTSAGGMTTAQEKNLVKKLSMLDKAVVAARDYMSPREISKYSHELAVTFNEFYEKVQVNREPDAALRDARLALVLAASRVLAQSLELMGIPFKSRI
jgi:arginyl-tRNA synthetase